MENKYELLAPVGNFAMLHAAIDAGADAVYFGIQGLNMRAGAKNFTVRDLPKIRKICERNKKKIKRYLTINTIVFDDELKKVELIVKKAKENVTAVICWDLSVIQLCKKYKVPFHISTQASIANEKSAEFYKNLGAERVVLARELNLKQIKKISKIIEVETFCHGAMCVAVSGRCFTSQFLHGISANRGMCAHPCRRAWTVTDDQGNQLKLENNRVMSAKDMCTLPFIEEMKKAGITSFKIEGRNRSPEYVRCVVSVYRKALDSKLTPAEIEDGLRELNIVYNRGFSDGFFFKTPTADDFSYTENGEQAEYKEYVGRVEKYWPGVGVGLVIIHAGVLSVGDEIYLMHDDLGIKRMKVESMEVEGKKVSSVNKGTEVGILMPKVPRGTEVYVIREKS